MALISVNSTGFSNYYSFARPRGRWSSQIICHRKQEGFRFNFSNWNQKERPLELISNNHQLFASGYESKIQAISVPITDALTTSTIELLDSYEDEYDGVIIDHDSLPASTNAFAAILQSSLLFWKQKGKKGIWLKILEHQADLIPIALKEGFKYHHAEPRYIMLTCWLSDEPCMIPSTATNQVGVGGFVINENKEVLVVKENKCPLRCSGIWKLPTGHIDKSEEIFGGAIREIKEETGIDTTFLEVVAFRHAHNVLFEMSDLFFLCMLKPLSREITIDNSEIQEAKWMPLNEFLEQPLHQEDMMLKSMMDICVARYNNHYSGFTTRCMMSRFDDRLIYLYHGELRN